MRVLVMHDDSRVARYLAATLREEGETAVEIRRRSARSAALRQPQPQAVRLLRSLER